MDNVESEYKIVRERSGDGAFLAKVNELASKGWRLFTTHKRERRWIY